MRERERAGMFNGGFRFVVYWCQPNGMGAGDADSRTAEGGRRSQAGQVIYHHRKYTATKQTNKPKLENKETKPPAFSPSGFPFPKKKKYPPFSKSIKPPLKFLLFLEEEEKKP